MAIKDKDGNVYKLRGPNPVMKSQQRWDEAKLVFHNMQFGTVVMADDRRRTTLAADPEPAIGKEEVIPDLSQFDVDPPVLVEEPLPPPPKVEPKIQVDDRIARMLEEKKTVFHCLPVGVHHFEDAFYGETTTRTSFGQKFSFPGIVVKWDDLQLTFWTDRELPDRSIVFPTKLEMKRWWRIQESAPKSGGYMVSAIPSDISPDFS